MPPAKRHFRYRNLIRMEYNYKLRETQEWRRKRRRIITKIRAMGRFQLQFLLSRMPVS